MNIAKLPWLALVVLMVIITLAVGCTAAGPTPAGELPQEGTPFSHITGTPPPSKKSEAYTTRELALKETGSPTALWEGKIIYTARFKLGEKWVSRIVEHDLATGRESLLIEAQPPHTTASSLHRLGEWLFYVEGGTTESGPAAFNPPQDFYAFNLRTGQRQQLLKTQASSCIGFPAGPDLSGNAFGEDGFAYIRSNRSSGECRDQLRVYNIETGEDRLLLEADSADTVFDNPILRGGKVFFNQGWRANWPPGITPTPMPGRPGPWPPRYQLTGDIFSLDLKTGEKVNLSNTASASQPAIWDNYLMWIDEPVRAAQEHGSGEVYILNMGTGKLRKLTSDATYMHLYSSPRAGDGFFVWGDAHLSKDKLPVYLPESDEIVYLEGPGGRPRVDILHTDGSTLFWSWEDMVTPQSDAISGGSRKVYMTTLE